MNDVVKFAKEILRFTPTEYQIKLLTDENKRIVVIWPRQSGKTTTLSVRMIWFAAEHPRTISLIVAPGLPRPTADTRPRFTHPQMKNRKHRVGIPRSCFLGVRLYVGTYLALRGEAIRSKTTMSQVAERSIMKELKHVSGLFNSRQAIVKQLRAVQASIRSLTAMGSAVAVAGSVQIPGNVHLKEPRQERRNKISEKAMAAFEEVYQLLQAKAFAEEQLLKAEGYMVLARLAEVNEIILRDAGDEELFEKLEELDQANDHLEESTEQLEAEAKEASGKT